MPESISICIRDCGLFGQDLFSLVRTLWIRLSFIQGQKPGGPSARNMHFDYNYSRVVQAMVGGMKRIGADDPSGN